MGYCAVFLSPRHDSREGIELWETISSGHPSTLEGTMNTARYLRQRSKEICGDNQCTVDEHHCESYAYFDESHRLLDICLPDYFAGHNGEVAAIPLPWTG